MGRQSVYFGAMAAVHHFFVVRKKLEKLILEGRINHYGNQVLAWMAANVVASCDPEGNIKPDKQRSREKIDGIVSLIMALDRALRRRPSSQSVYEKRGVLAI